MASSEEKAAGAAGNAPEPQDGQAAGAVPEYAETADAAEENKPAAGAAPAEADADAATATPAEAKAGVDTAAEQAASAEENAAYAPLIEHLMELRARLMKALIAFALAFFFCFAVKNYILSFLLLPYQWAINFAGGDPGQMMLQSTAVLETFVTKMKIAAFGGVALAFPFIAFQLYRFIAPGLYKNERAAFLPFLCSSPLLFIIGGAFVYGIIAPLLLWFGLSQQQLAPNIEIHFIAKISEYLDFMTGFILIFGLVFQLPVICALLVRAGLLKSAQLIAARKWEIVLSFIIAAMLTPSDLFSMFGLALPLVLLYEISIMLARRIEKREARKRAAQQ